ncbi:transcriptional regulator [Levilactobacillus zymae]|uniref:Transcriptional regulator n=1 Tax=Levilactobacillus zymae TaxID=267363 RepID=A0ABQ0WWQ4_9LACO|nr:PLP-dependent aminotransferase family protein [Levilactobacillus zymae]KRL13200.1 hypothetical protein FD38_GL001326 [Levilactobacillus zymae DSM 19395]QFR61212.1 GntR family transcriptional regulator [Levilactobacillus zymae]GEO72211.1 transcriptional regulator [Levilactobacillus zymae]
MLTLNRQSHEQLYHQLYRQLRAEIETGVRQPGQVLASTRFLAQQLRVSRNTVDHAYQDLVAEGYVVSKPGAGYHVAQQLPYLTDMSALTQPATTEKFRYDFTESYDHLRLFPKQAWRNAEQAMMFTGLPHIQPANGDLQYRRQLVAMLARVKGIHATPEQLVVTSGFNEAAGIIANLLPELTAGQLGVANPTAPNARHVWPRLDVPTVPFTPETPPTTWPAALGYLLTPTHNFPTSYGFTVAERHRLTTWAQAKHRYLIELDTDGTLDYGGTPAPALTHDYPERTFYYSNYDDTLGSALCLGFLVIPADLVPTYQAKYSKLPNRNSQWQQQIVSHLIANDALERFMRQLTLVYANRRQLLLDTLQTAFGAALVPMGAPAGTFVTLHLTTGERASDVIATAAQAGVGLVDPDRCWVDLHEDYQSLVLSFRQVDDAQIIAGIRAWQTVWHPRA